MGRPFSSLQSQFSEFATNRIIVLFFKDFSSRGLNKRFITITVVQEILANEYGFLFGWKTNFPAK
jgi:hypothetical protein